MYKNLSSKTCIKLITNIHAAIDLLYISCIKNMAPKEVTVKLEIAKEKVNEVRNIFIHELVKEDFDYDNKRGN